MGQVLALFTQSKNLCFSLDGRLVNCVHTKKFTVQERLHFFYFFICFFLVSLNVANDFPLQFDSDWARVEFAFCWGCKKKRWDKPPGIEYLCTQWRWTHLIKHFARCQTLSHHYGATSIRKTALKSAQNEKMCQGTQQSTCSFLYQIVCVCVCVCIYVKSLFNTHLNKLNINKD